MTVAALKRMQLTPALCFAALFARAAPIDDLRATAQDTYGALRNLHMTYAGLVSRHAARSADEFVKIVLLDGNKQPLLDLYLHCRAGRCLWGSAWATGTSPWIHRVGVDSLEVSGRGPGLSVKGGAALFLADPAAMLDRPENRQAAIELTVNPSRSSRPSRFAADPMRALQFQKSGTVHASPLKGASAAGPARRKVALGTANSRTMYDLLLSWESLAMQLYRQLRVLEHARIANTSVEKIAAGHHVHLPKRPRFAAPPSQPAKAAGAAPEPAAAGPGLDDVSLDDDLSVDEPGGSVDGLGTVLAAVSEDKREVIEKRLRVARDIGRHVRLMAAAAANQLTLGAGRDSFVLGSLLVEDPEFGPWYGFEPLPERGDKVNIVPSGSGGEGAPHWPHVRHWRMVGPFRRGTFANLHMPDMFPVSPGILDVVAINTTLMSGTQVKERHSTPETSTWRDKLMEPASGVVRPWRMNARGRGNIPGLANATFFLATTIWAEEDAELWAGGRVDDACLLWVNERLVCSWPAPGAAASEESTALFKIKLRRGENRIVARLDNDRDWTGLSLRLCLRGKPRPAAAAREQMAAARREAARLAARDDHIFGWRRRSNGYFADAEPPLAWDIQTGVNMRWRRGLGSGKSHPVIAGDKLIVSVDPIFLVCLNKLTGEKLWEREMNVLELIDPGLFRESQTLRQTWQDTNAKAARAAGSEPGDVDALRKEAGAARRKWWDFICKRGGIQKGSAWGNYVGHMFAAPVTDGRHVWVKCAAGVAACFDLDGNRRWMVKTDYGDNGFSFCSSPVLIDGKLIFELPVADKAFYHSELKMVCLDAATGRLLWEAPRIRNLHPASSPVAVHLSNGTESTAVVVTGGGILAVLREDDLDDISVVGGTVVRVDDGKVLIENLGVNSGWSSPNVVGDRVFHVGGRYGSCTRLIMVNRDLVGARRIWTRITGDFDGGLVHHEGLLHGLPGGQFPSGFQFLEAATGKRHIKPVNINTFYGKFGRAYTPPSYAGGYVFMSDDGTALGRPMRATKVFVMQAGRRGRLLARNLLEPNMIPSLVFDGDRIYSRSTSSVICLGHTGEEGVAEEAEIVARTLMEDLPVEAPRSGSPEFVAAVGGRGGGGPFSCVPVLNEDWYLVGPYPASETEAILTAMGGPKLGIPADRPSYRGQPLTRQHLNRHSKIRIHHRTTRNLFGLAPLGGEQAGKVVYYHRTFSVPEERTVRLLCDRMDADLWLSGTPVQHQDRLTLAAGNHVLLVRYSAPDPLPANPMMDLRLLDSPDVEAEIRSWRESIEGNRATLERVVELRPKSEAAARAKALLDKL